MGAGAWDAIFGAVMSVHLGVFAWLWVRKRSVRYAVYVAAFGCLAVAALWRAALAPVDPGLAAVLLAWTGRALFACGLGWLCVSWLAKKRRA